jgi:CBS domain-containing protein
MTMRTVHTVLRDIVPTLEATTTLDDAEKIMGKRDAAVVVRDGRLAGLLLADDLAAARPSAATTLAIAEVTGALMTIPVSRVMRRAVETVVPETPLAEAARLVRDSGAPVVVLAGELPIGLVSAQDLLRALADVELAG